MKIAGILKNNERAEGSEKKETEKEKGNSKGFSQGAKKNPKPQASVNNFKSMNKKELQREVSIEKEVRGKEKYSNKEKLMKIREAADGQKGDQVMDAMSSMLNKAMELKEKANKYRQGGEMSE